MLSDKAAEGKGNNLVSGNRLKEYNGIEYTYDALGNLIYRQLPNGENQYYQYDLENQLVRAEIKKPAGNTEIWTYAYDPFGRRLSKERQDKLAWTSTDPKRTHFVWDGTRLLQEYTYKGSYTYIYTDQDSYEPLAQIFDNAKDSKQYLAYFHNDQISIPREMTDIHGNLLWYGEYTAWGRLKKDERVYKNAHQPFRLQNQYFDEETGLHYNLMRYYEPEAGRFVNQDPIGLLGGDNLYAFAPSTQAWVDPLGLANLFDIGTYGSLNSSTHVGDGLQAHELIRHEALVQNGYTTKNNRLSQNPAIALDLDHHTRGPAKDTRGIGGTHYHEAEIRRSHYGLGRNQMHTDLHREIDIAQGGLRKTGTPKAQRKRLRKEAKKFLRKLKKTGKKCP
ncbi:RHS repeat domain-containing protein [Neisseria perflava]|uniref:RHS repeat domain-containing protein n=1 Tax=Neisseria perflava TaxID=33053 RepID=UPI001955331D